MSRFLPIISLSLRAGGVAIHLRSEKDLLSILNFTWPEKAFGDSGLTLDCHKERNDPKIILKNVNPEKPEKDLQDLLFQLTGIRNKILRFKYRDSGKPLPVVKATFQSEKGIKHLLSNKKLSIDGVEVKVEEYKYLHRREVKCLYCNQLDHVVKDCTEI